MKMSKEVQPISKHEDILDFEEKKKQIPISPLVIK